MERIGRWGLERCRFRRDTRVETIVAMEFAESFHPLANSKRSAVITITQSRVPESMGFFLESVVENGIQRRAKACLYPQSNFLA